jgi:hypothetical protein
MRHWSRWANLAKRTQSHKVTQEISWSSWVRVSPFSLRGNWSLHGESLYPPKQHIWKQEEPWHHDVNQANQSSIQRSENWSVIVTPVDTVVQDLHAKPNQRDCLLKWQTWIGPQIGHNWKPCHESRKPQCEWGKITNRQHGDGSEVGITWWRCKRRCHNNIATVNSILI